MNSADTEYITFRGKCKEMSEAEVAKDPTLRLVRGYYHCPMWGTQQHWWCERKDGSVLDPTARQFPSRGMGDYEEFDGMCACEVCGKKTHETETYFNGHHPYCSYECAYRDVM